MPICKKCDLKFPNLFLIDGKKRNLCKRKYCLTCSPFGLHNIRKLHIPMMEYGDCKICKKKYNHKNRKKGHRGNICGSCLVTRHRQRLKEKLVEYKGGKCEKCGYGKSFWALDFHHQNPNAKLFAIGGKTIALSKLKLEADKCVLVCRNCHSELHEREYNKILTGSTFGSAEDC